MGTLSCVTFLARIGLLGVSVATIVWLAFAFHSADIETRAVERFQSGQVTSGADVEELASMFREANRHNPDILPEVEEGYLYITTDRAAQALPVLQEVIRKEPNNYFALKLLAAAAADENPKLAEEAELRLEEVDPKGTG